MASQRKKGHHLRHETVTFNLKIPNFPSQCVQAAISGAIDTMYKENPNRKVGLVTFNGEVSVLGDGLQLSETVVGDKLNNYEQLFKVNFTRLSTHLPPGRTRL